MSSTKSSSNGMTYCDFYAEIITISELFIDISVSKVMFVETLLKVTNAKILIGI